MSVSAAELRAQIRGWRRGRAELRWLDVISDAYVVLLAVLMLGSMLVSAIVHAGQAVSACSTAQCHGARAAGPLLVLLGWLALLTALLRLLGPLVASPAMSAIVLATPVDRAAWLRRQYAVGLAVSGAAAAVLTAVVSVLAGWPALTIGALAVGAAALAVLAYAAAAVAQPQVRSWWAVGHPIAAIALVAALLAIALGATARLRPPGGAVWWAPAAAVVLLAGITSLHAGRRLGLLRRRDLTRGHGLARGLSGAMSGLDPALAFDVVLAHTTRQRPVVRPRRGGLPGPLALLWADLIRLRRHPVRLVVLAAAAIVAYALDRAGAGALVMPGATIVGFLAAIPFFAGLRVLTRSNGLGRLLGHSPASLRLHAMAVPSGLLIGYGLCCLAALPSPLLALAVGLGATAAAARWILGRPPDYGRPLVSSPMGGVPTNLYGSAIRGFDIAALVSIPVLFLPNASGAVLSLLCSAITLAVLVGRR